MDERRPVKSYRDLDVWQKGMVLARQVYEATKTCGAVSRMISRLNQTLSAKLSI